MLMCMCMLDKRLQLLLRQDQWKTVLYRAKAANLSVGAVIRRALDQAYSTDEEIKRQRTQAVADIIRIRPHFKGKIDYEKLINSGRER